MWISVGVGCPHPTPARPPPPPHARRCLWGKIAYQRGRNWILYWILRVELAPGTQWHICISFRPNKVESRCRLQMYVSSNGVPSGCFGLCYALAVVCGLFPIRTKSVFSKVFSSFCPPQFINTSSSFLCLVLSTWLRIKYEYSHVLSIRGF